MTLFYKLLIIFDIVIFATFLIYVIIKNTKAFNTRPQTIVTENIDTSIDASVKNVDGAIIKTDIVVGDLEEIKKIKDKKDKNQESDNQENKKDN